VRPGRAGARLALAVLGVVAMAAPGPTRTWAQTPAPFALQTFDPPPAGDRFLTGPGPLAPGHLAQAAALTFSWAHDPLVLRADGVVPPGGRVVHRQAWGWAQGSLGLGGRLLLEVAAPVALWQTGWQPLPELPAVAGSGLGDLRLGARATLLERPLGALALAAAVHLPTGSRAAFASDGAARLQLSAVAGGRRGAVAWAAQLGILTRPDRDLVITRTGPALLWTAAAAWHHGAWRLGPELSGRVQPRGSGTSPAEALLSAGRALGDLDLSLGAGTGLGRAPGSAPFRALLRATWRLPPPPPPPVMRLDRDGDGIPDDEDACPDAEGVRSADPARNGCLPAPPPPVLAPDRDGDRVPDLLDACPDVPGVVSAVKGMNGCPPLPTDRDRDGIPDDKDQCPDVAGMHHADPALEGCPATGRDLAVLTRTKVEVLQPIQFETNEDRLLPVSEPVLSAVAAVLNGHPELGGVRVEGHTDSQGDAAFNLELSARRAAAVRRWLVEKGRVAEARLTAQGFGASQPIADNASAAGRARNRRVEFRLLEARGRP